MANFESLTPEQIRELQLSPEELRELEHARALPIVFDEDSPETTPARAVKFRRVNPRRDDNRRHAF